MNHFQRLREKKEIQAACLSALKACEKSTPRHRQSLWWRKILLRLFTLLWGNLLTIREDEIELKVTQRKKKKGEEEKTIIEVWDRKP